MSVNNPQIIYNFVWYWHFKRFISWRCCWLIAIKYRINHYIKNGVSCPETKKKRKRRNIHWIDCSNVYFNCYFLTTMKRNKEIKLSKQRLNGKRNVYTMAKRINKVKWRWLLTGGVGATGLKKNWRGGVGRRASLTVQTAHLILSRGEIMLLFQVTCSTLSPSPWRHKYTVSCSGSCGRRRAPTLAPRSNRRYN